MVTATRTGDVFYMYAFSTMYSNISYYKIKFQYFISSNIQRATRAAASEKQQPLLELLCWRQKRKWALKTIGNNQTVLFKLNELNQSSRFIYAS
jgi:hypothetical protein